jgi:hypothetical protein
MNLLDENILASQRELLRSWRISTRQIGFDFQPQGLQDDQVISLLHEHRRTTFFTRDLGFYDRSLCHGRYCLVCLAVSKDMSCEQHLDGTQKLGNALRASIAAGGKD